MRLIPGIGRAWWRLWSIRLNAIGVVVQSAFLAWATLPLEIWNIMPGEVKDILPPIAVRFLPIAFFVAAMAARLFKQDKIHEKTD